MINKDRRQTAKDNKQNHPYFFRKWKNCGSSGVYSAKSEAGGVDNTGTRGWETGNNQ
jgi:hypothetical protein